jgi:hypothetical protein
VRHDLRMTGSWNPCTDQLMDAIVPAFLARPVEAAIFVLTITCADYPRPTRVLAVLIGNPSRRLPHPLPVSSTGKNLELG